MRFCEQERSLQFVDGIHAQSKSGKCFYRSLDDASKGSMMGACNHGVQFPMWVGVISLMADSPKAQANLFKTGWRLWPPTRAISPGRGSRLSKPIDRTHIA